MSYVYWVHNGSQDLFWWNIEVILGDNFKTNKLVRLAKQIDWGIYCDPINEAYSRKWRASLPVRQMIALEMLKYMRWWISDEKLIEEFKVNLSVMYFCGYKNVHDAQRHIPRNSSSMTHFRTRIATVEWLDKKLQEVHLQEVLIKVPKKRRGQYDQDSTVIDESIAHPHDINLLAKFADKAGKLLDKCRKVPWKLCAWIVAKGRRVIKKLKMKYHFWGKKSQILWEIKEEMIEIWENMVDMLETLKENFENVAQKWNKLFKKVTKELEDLWKLWKEFLSQQKEMLEKGTKKVANRIVSLHKQHIRPIIKWKTGKKTQFWWKLQVWVIGKTLSMVVWLSWENKHDAKTMKDGIEEFKKVCWKPPDETGGDKWYRDKEWWLYEYMGKEGVKNCIQWTEDWKKLDKKTRKRLYNRRAFVEPLINDIKNHRGLNHNKLKKEHTQRGCIMACITSNYARVYA